MNIKDIYKIFNDLGFIVRQSQKEAVFYKTPIIIKINFTHLKNFTITCRNCFTNKTANESITAEEYISDRDYVHVENEIKRIIDRNLRKIYNVS